MNNQLLLVPMSLVVDCLLSFYENLIILYDGFQLVVNLTSFNPHSLEQSLWRFWAYTLHTSQGILSCLDLKLPSHLHNETQA